ncbi:DNA integrity scanning protein DisA nucleotide-binding domain protein [Aquibacillus rhizosphaerae]|uniref:DNA integrity scanning protein DisA nucleotide-binding domain protein n=1 Tax=Aquibacillus rhizosphaerae TaxID=3051431 RepID=A0ABT7L3B9_9BACI|nr:DNA integrity scanning protein DisA nucleotide-binding domain protein [Aquibacillus sp. LR5S19]MDL4840357.1 DNA integrity scanning protein DisA nucleotide-binding domain protein [Aquibacillus sp. LR5S19]
MDEQVLNYLVTYISDVLGIKAEQKNSIVIFSKTESKIIFGDKNFNVNRLTYRSYDFYIQDIPNTDYRIYIPNKYHKYHKNHSNKSIKCFIKHTCHAANRVQEVILQHPNIDKNELLDLIKRLSIPAVLEEFYSESTPRIARSVTQHESINYGKIIREILGWKNHTIEGKEIHTGIIIGDNLLRIEETLKSSTIKGSYEIINLQSNPDLTSFKEVKPLLEIADGLNTFLICEPHENSNLIVSGLLITEKGLMTNLIGNTTKGFNAPVFSLREKGLRIGRGNELIMEYINNTPRIRNYNELSNIFREYLLLNIDNANKLTALILEISHLGKGASIVFNFKNKYIDDVEKTQWIKPRKVQFIGEKVFVDIFPNLTKTDGAVLLNSNMEIVGFGSILKPTKAKAKIPGGSRHKSMASFSHNKDILGIVISEDGPITVIQNNSVVFSL